MELEYVETGIKTDADQMYVISTLIPVIFSLYFAFKANLANWDGLTILS